MIPEPIAWMKGRDKDHCVKLTGEPWRRALCGRTMRLQFLTPLSTDTAKGCRTCLKRLRKGLTSW